jgi:hypothetical protein
MTAPTRTLWVRHAQTQVTVDGPRGEIHDGALRPAQDSAP